MSKRGRPKISEEIKQLNLNTYQEDLVLFKNGLIDSLEDEENDDVMSKQTISKFLNMESWKQNIFIVYILNKKRYKFQDLADVLNVNRLDLRRAINQIKTELQEI